MWKTSFFPFWTWLSCYKKLWRERRFWSPPSVQAVSNFQFPWRKQRLVFATPASLLELHAECPTLLLLKLLPFNPGTHQLQPAGTLPRTGSLICFCCCNRKASSVKLVKNTSLPLFINRTKGAIFSQKFLPGEKEKFCNDSFTVLVCFLFLQLVLEVWIGYNLIYTNLVL